MATELSRRSGESSGPVEDAHGIWQVPVALLLPPAYGSGAATIAAIVMALLGRRTHRALIYRTALSAAASVLSIAAASTVFRMVRPSWTASAGPLPAAPLPAWRRRLIGRLVRHL